MNALDIDFLLEQNELKPVSPLPDSISKWSEENRTLPTNTPFPGKWSNSRTPYSIEIMDNLGPFSPVRITDILKGAQLGLTGAAECVIGFYMRAAPCEIMYISANQDLIDRWSSKRLEPLIDSIGMRDRLCATNNNSKSRKTGDKATMKQFIGGALTLASAQSASSLRSDSIKIMVMDELDGARKLLATGEGNWVKVAMARLNGFGSRGKALRFGTPAEWDTSAMRECWEQGDKRYFNVSCPLCSKAIVLEFENLKPEFRAGHLYDVTYQCQKCGGHLHNYHKAEMLAGGEWRPTAVPADKDRRSYHIGSIYSPVGMMTWFSLYREYLEAQETPDGMRSFTNLYLGLPYKERGARPSLDKVVELRGDYHVKTIPPGVLFLTAGADVQRGSEKDPKNPPRIEMEVCGHGIGFRSYSIEYLTFEGAIDDPYSGAWAKLQEWAESGGLQYTRDDGRNFVPDLILIDSGDGMYSSQVFQFASRWQGTYASKGFSALKKKKNDVGDAITSHNWVRYRVVRSKSDATSTLVEVSTNQYKARIYSALNTARQEVGPQNPGFLDSPMEYGEKYFKMLTAEEKLRDGTFVNSANRRNEALDVKVLNLCACDIHLDSKVHAMKLAAKTKGASDIEIQAITQKVVLELLAKRTARLI